MSIIKAILLLIIFLSVYKILNFFGGEKKREVMELKTYSKVLGELYIEVNTFSTPILKAIEKVFVKYEKYDLIYKKFDMQLKNDIGEIDFIFLDVLKSFDKKFYFSVENKRFLYELANIFTTMDRVSLESQLIYLHNCVEKEISFLENQAKEEVALFKKLSILGALAFVVILI